MTDAEIAAIVDAVADRAATYPAQRAQYWAAAGTAVRYLLPAVRAQPLAWQREHG